MISNLPRFVGLRSVCQFLEFLLNPLSVDTGTGHGYRHGHADGKL